MDALRGCGLQTNLFQSTDTMKLPSLLHWRDSVFRTAAANMALDEALFHWSSANHIAVARFYHWNHSAVTVGYFNHEGADGQTTVRRFTGGGLVEHGEDLTFLLTFPAGSAVALAPGGERYRHIHAALAESLDLAGFSPGLAPEQNPSSPGPCFANPVPWDLLDPGTSRKIGGGAQRRSRGAVIHQGSIRLPKDLRNPMAPWIEDFLSRMSERTGVLDPVIRENLCTGSLRIEKERYSSSDWNSGT